MTPTEYKTVAVFGAAYAGARAATLLAQGLPDGWRVVVVDRNSHANHVYILPRLAVLPGHEHKAFVPYDRIFRRTDPATSPAPQHEIIHASVTSLSPHSAVLTHPDGNTSTLDFSYCIYALGSKLPDPTNVWAAPIAAEAKQRNCTGTKKEGVQWLKDSQAPLANAKSVLIVGGGALGIQFASDIAAIYPECAVTLLHSRKVLLPRFDNAMGIEILSSLESLNVNVILGERLDLSCKRRTNDKGEVIMRTLSGMEVRGEVVLMCTGQSPNTSVLTSMDARTVDVEGHRMACVLSTMQLGIYGQEEEEEDEVDSVSSSSFSDAGEVREGGVYENYSGATTAVTSVVDFEEKVAALSIDEEIVTAEERVDETTPSVVFTADLDEKERAVVEHVSEVLNEVLDVDVDVAVEMDKVVVIPDADSEEEEEVDIYAGVPKTTPYPHMFVAGDAADGFGAIKAGHVAYFQAEVAARNILRLIGREERPEDEFEPLEDYRPGPPAIKVSLGLTKAVYQINGVVGTNEDNVPDLHAAGIWAHFGYPEVGKEGGENGMFA